VVLGFYHLYAALATDDRFEVDDAEGEWAYSERYSAWIVEQIIRHHERDFGAFERIDATPEEFSAAAERDEREEASDEATEGAEGGAADGEESNTDDSEDPESASSGAVD